jgi:hypothetical protein
MQRSPERILTTFVGSLARPADLTALMQAKETGQPCRQRLRVLVIGQRGAGNPSLRRVGQIPGAGRGGAPGELAAVGQIGTHRG